MIRSTLPLALPRIGTFRALLTLVAAFACPGGTAQAQSGTWIQTTAGPYNWSDTANWSGGTVANGSGNTASFIANITANQTVTLDSNRIIGNITFTDTGTTSNDLTISGGNTLTLAGTPIINVTNRTLTISSQIAGSDGFTKNGVGTLVLSNASNSFTGDVSINAGTLNFTASGSVPASQNFVFTGNSTLSLANALAGYVGGNVHVNSGVTAIIFPSTGNSHSYASATSGSTTSVLQVTGNGNSTITINDVSAFTGVLRVGPGSGSAPTFKIGNLADGTSYGNLQFGGATANTATFEIFNNNGTLTLNNRQIEILSTSTAANANLVNNQGSTSNNWVINTSLINSRSGTTTLGLGGTNTGNNTFAGVIGNGSGTIAVTKTGGGTWILSGTNTYTGATTITAGTLSVNSLANYSAPSAIGQPSSGAIVLGSAGNTGTLEYTGSGNSSNRQFQIGPISAANGSGIILNNGTGALTFTATTFNTDDPTTGGSAGPRTLTLGGSYSGVNEIQGAILANTGAPTLRDINIVKNGIGTWSLAGANTYTGGNQGGNTINLGTLRGTQTSGTPFGTGSVTINAGTLSLAPTGSGTAVSVTGGTKAANTLFTYNPGATLSLDRGSQTSLTYTFGGTGNTTARGTNGTLILSTSDITQFGAATAGTNFERFIINGTAPTQVNTLVSGVVIQDRNNSNAGDFAAYDVTTGYTKATYTLTNTFTGSTNASRIEITSGTSTSGATAIYALKVGGATVTNTGNTITLGSSGNPVAGLILNGGTISGGTLLTPASSATEFAIYTSGTSVISSSINTATSQAGMSVFGPGTLDFSGSSGNSFTGALRINNSTVIATNNNQLGGTSSNIALLGGTLETSGTFALGGGSRAFTLSPGQDQTGGTFNVTSGTTTLQNASASSKIISGTGSLTKTGSGTLDLTGNTANTYSGGTFVNEGTLLANSTSGSSTGTGNVTVGGVSASGTPTLGGTGTISGSVIVASAGGGAAGTIRGGDGTTVGTLNLANGLALNSNSTLAVRINAAGTANPGSPGGSSTGSNNSSLNITGGTTTINSGTLFSIDGSGATFTTGQSYSYQIMSGAGNQSSLNITNPSQFSSNISNAGDFVFSITGNSGGAVFINFTPVPEPATVLGLAVAALGLGRLIRRRVTSPAP